MADWATIPPPTTLYPQPPQQQPGVLSGGPGSIVDLATKIQQNYALQQELKGRAAVGQAYQGALQPDGTLDPEKLRAGLANPDASWLLPETTTHMLAQQGAQFDIRAKQDQATRQLLGSLPENASREDVWNYAAQLARIGVPPGLITGWLNGAPRDPKAFKDWINNTRISAMSPGEQSTRVEGAPGPRGERQSTPLATATRAGTMPVGLPPGGVESAQEMRADLSRQGGLLSEMSPFKNALDAANSLRSKYGAGVFGPGSEGRNAWESYLQSFSPTLARLTGVDPEKLRDYENARKYLTMSAQQRAATMGHGTDEQLATSLKATPNVSMNDLSVDDLIKSQIAMRRAEYAQVQQASRKGGPGYTEEKSRWPATNDIRAFSLDLLTPEARAKLLGSLRKGTPEYERFNNSLQAAYETGMIDRPSATTTVAPLAPGARKDQSRAPSGEPFRTLPPDENAPPPKPPLPSVKLGRHTDGSPRWYIEDARRPGKYLEVRQPFPGMGQ